MNQALPISIDSKRSLTFEKHNCTQFRNPIICGDYEIFLVVGWKNLTEVEFSSWKNWTTTSCVRYICCWILVNWRINLERIFPSESPTRNPNHEQEREGVNHFLWLTLRELSRFVFKRNRISLRRLKLTRWSVAHLTSKRKLAAPANSNSQRSP